MKEVGFRKLPWRTLQCVLDVPTVIRRTLPNFSFPAQMRYLNGSDCQVPGNDHLRITAERHFAGETPSLQVLYSIKWLKVPEAAWHSFLPRLDLRRQECKCMA